MTSLIPTPSPGVQPNRWLLSAAFEDAKQAIFRLECLMLGWHFTDQTAEEIRAAAKRLSDLCEPKKGLENVEGVARPLKDAA